MIRKRWATRSSTSTVASGKYYNRRMVRARSWLRRLKMYLMAKNQTVTKEAMGKDLVVALALGQKARIINHLLVRAPKVTLRTRSNPPSTPSKEGWKTRISAQKKNKKRSLRRLSKHYASV